MRALFTTLALILWTATAAALDIEEETTLPGTPGGPKLEVLSTTDIAYFAPVLRAFQARNPDITIRYVVAGSQDVFSALAEDAAAFDLAISSAMDLQMKLANDGLALPYEPKGGLSLPGWAQWQDRVYSIAQEPVVLILSDRALSGGLAPPRTRREVVDLLRDHPDRFQGRVGTYDARLSGAGYLFATQEARQSDSFWRLAEVMGASKPLLYTSSSDMLDDLQSGRLIMAYNVLGSYSALSTGANSGLHQIEFQDFTLTLLRTALIPVSAASPDLGALFLDYLLSPEGRVLIAQEAGLPPVDETALFTRPHLRPIRLDPGLLVYLDQIKRRAFLEEWSAAIMQP
jgi:iron(III) transport system substrate-binding protein